MHELSVTQGILTVATEAAQQHGAQRISAIDLVIGELSSIVDDCVQFYFDILSEGTLAQGAVLRFSRRPAVATCEECGQQVNATLPLQPLCAACGSSRLRISGGNEFYVGSIEVEDEDTSREADSERQRSGGG